MTTRELKRLIADEGKVLQNTKTGKTAYCVDVFAENVDLWKEIEDVNTKEDEEEQYGDKNRKPQPDKT